MSVLGSHEINQRRSRVKDPFTLVQEYKLLGAAKMAAESRPKPNSKHRSGSTKMLIRVESYCHGGINE